MWTGIDITCRKGVAENLKTDALLIVFLYKEISQDFMDNMGYMTFPDRGGVDLKVIEVKFAIGSITKMIMHFSMHVEYYGDDAGERKYY